MQESKKQNSVIVYLTRLNDLWVFRYSIKLLCLNFNKEYNYPIIVFHTDLTNSAISKVLSELIIDLGYLPDIKFEKISNTVPDDVSTEESKYTFPLLKYGHGINYRNMCRFLGGQIFKHSALSNYQFYMKLDSDSFILSKLTYDPFTHMKDNGYEYSFLESKTQDSDYAHEGFWDCTKKFIDSNITRINNPYPTEWDGKVYNPNFEMVNIDFFRNNNYQDYFDYIDGTRNIYYKRWGDHCIKQLGIKMFMKPNKILCITDIGYLHGSDIKNMKHVEINSVMLLPEPFKTNIMKQIESIHHVKQ